MLLEPEEKAGKVSRELVGDVPGKQAAGRRLGRSLEREYWSS